MLDTKLLIPVMLFYSIAVVYMKVNENEWLLYNECRRDTCNCVINYNLLYSYVILNRTVKLTLEL